MKKSVVDASVILIVMLLATACGPQQRLGMVIDYRTGLQYGSSVSRDIVVDPSQFANRKVKVRIRNTSGDPAFDLHGFRSLLESAYVDKGYELAGKADFGILIDVNVVYSGQVSKSRAREFGLLGASAGGLVGVSEGGALGSAAGIVTGATLGAIIGSHVSEDTYIVVANLNLGVMRLEAMDRGTTIVFSASRNKERKKKPAMRTFERATRNRIAVYAGGRNTPQSEIAGGVRQRFLRILSDVI